MKINNLPRDIKSYIVARLVDNYYWFFGTYDEMPKAFRVAEEICGAVFRKEEVM